MLSHGDPVGVPQLLHEDGIRPRVAIITNIEEDHLDCYSGIDDIVESFRTFARLVPADGKIIANGQDALQSGRGAVLPWFGLSVLFGLVSYDEFYGLHERLSDVLSHNVGGSGLLGRRARELDD